MGEEGGIAECVDMSILSCVHVPAQSLWPAAHVSLPPCTFGIAAIRVAICMIREVCGVLKPRKFGGLPKCISAECRTAVQGCKLTPSAATVSSFLEFLCWNAPTNCTERHRRQSTGVLFQLIIAEQCDFDPAMTPTVGALSHLRK